MNAAAKIARWSAVIASTAWGLLLIALDFDVSDDVRRLMAYLPSLLGLLVVAFDLWLWKAPGVSRLTGRPHLHGTWRAVLEPSEHSRIPDGGNRGPIPAAVVIEQSFWTLSVRLHTSQSSSVSSTAALVNDPDSKQSKNLYFTYANRAQQQHSQRSHAHYGTTHLNVVGTHPQHLSGTYWTDRLTSGDLSLELVDRRTDRGQTEAIGLL